MQGILNLSGNDLVLESVEMIHEIITAHSVQKCMAFTWRFLISIHPVSCWLHFMPAHSFCYLLYWHCFQFTVDCYLLFLSWSYYFTLFPFNLICSSTCHCDVCFSTGFPPVSDISWGFFVFFLQILRMYVFNRSYLFQWICSCILSH